MVQSKHPDRHSTQAGPPAGTKKKHPFRSPGQAAAKPDATSLWLYGQHAVAAALRNPDRKKLQFLATSAGLVNLAAYSKTLDLQAEIVDSQRIVRLLPAGAVHQGLALLAQHLPESDIKQVCAPQAGGPARLVVVLDQLTDPQNVGAILRSCAAFNATAVILTGRHAPPDTGALAKAASGAVELVPVVRTVNLARALEQLAALGYWRVGLDSEADQPIGKVDLSGNIALVLGAEGAGLRQLTASKCDFLARIPTDGQLASLNVSNAAAIILYEVARRRIPG